uniref:Uncharacterized protein n=1 Tax=Arundo donax TaxID=35708 RepID=A0A0A9CYV5_ARUDO
MLLISSYGCFWLCYKARKYCLRKSKR